MRYAFVDVAVDIDLGGVGLIGMPVGDAETNVAVKVAVGCRVWERGVAVGAECGATRWAVAGAGGCAGALVVAFVLAAAAIADDDKVREEGLGFDCCARLVTAVSAQSGRVSMHVESLLLASLVDIFVFLFV